jgi:ribosome-associated protein
MKPEDLKERNPEREFVFVASRSGGPGGQNVNKLNTKVELRFNIPATLIFNDVEKELLVRKLKNKINRDGELILVAQSERSQLLNKEAVIEKFYDLVSKALTIPVKRRPTKPTAASRRKRLEEKRNQADKKRYRAHTGISED